MKRCIHCGKPLKDSQYSDDKCYKSCPKCSVDDGEEHIFYPMDDFGTTPKRRTSVHPDGPQSYCQECRGENHGPHAGAIRCSAI